MVNPMDKEGNKFWWSDLIVEGKCLDNATRPEPHEMTRP